MAGDHGTVSKFVGRHVADSAGHHLLRIGKVFIAAVIVVVLRHHQFGGVYHPEPLVAFHNDVPFRQAVIRIVGGKAGVFHQIHILHGDVAAVLGVLLDDLVSLVVVSSGIGVGKFTFVHTDGDGDVLIQPLHIFNGLLSQLEPVVVGQVQTAGEQAQQQSRHHIHQHHHGNHHNGDNGGHSAVLKPAGG